MPAGRVRHTVPQKRRCRRTAADAVVICIIALTLIVAPAHAVDCACAHGTCADPGTCVCHASDALGHWSGPQCDNCAYGWAGPSCKRPCSGGPCSPCSGHGVCDSSLSGTGECTCTTTPAEGFWGGTACSDCAAGYYGVACTNACASDACSGHGACRDGRGGDGSCVCDDGWDSDTLCSTCLPSRWGPGCANDCMGTLYATGEPVACSGHGGCSSGVLGRGVCLACDAGWAGRDCGVPCACDSRHGTCSDGIAGDGSCVCLPHRLSPSCAECEDGYGGENCASRCPGDPPCSNRGLCVSVGRRAECVCEAGTTGASCDVACDGVVPCYGHGVCRDTSSGPTCTCERATDPPGAAGFWSEATDCFACEPGFSGHTDVDGLCTLRCPSIGGKVCSGRGRCVEGQCLCDLRWMDGVAASSCGKACEIDEALCTDLCEEAGHYKPPGCVSTCPGMVPGARGFDVPCNGRGYCSVAADRGECVCNPPVENADGVWQQWGGGACEVACPTSNVTDTPCGYPAHGACDSEGACTCAAGHYGAACDEACPRVFGQICNGRGICDDGVRGSGACTCDAEWAGESCGIHCACNDHSECDVITGSCTCIGNFTGDKCQNCQQGTYGDGCAQTCYGKTVGTGCYCSDETTGPDCSALCPTTNSAVCNGHGACNDGSLACSCDGGWYGEACEVACTPQNCTDTYGYEHSACSPEGECVCAAQRAGAGCEECSGGYWGTVCENVCECSGNGVCERATGACVCHGSRDEGFYVGDRCERCAPGFTGVRCDYPQVCTTQGRDLAPAQRDALGNVVRVTSAPPHTLWVDTRAGGGYIFAGGQPPLAWVATRPDEVSVLDSALPTAGRLRDIHATDGALYLVFAPGVSAATQLVMYTPIPRPLVVTRGDPFAGGAVQVVSDVEATSISQVTYDGQTFVFTLEAAGTQRTLRMVRVPCAGAPCASDTLPVPPHITAIAAGVGIVWLAGGGEAGFFTVAFDDRGGLSNGAFGSLAPLALPAAVQIVAVDFVSIFARRGLVAVARDASGDTVVLKWTQRDDATHEDNWIRWPGIPTALAVDDVLPAAFVASDSPDGAAPGGLVKISLAEERPVIYDVATLSHITVQGLGAVPEVIRAFHVDGATRTLYGLVAPGTSMKLVSFLLWEVGRQDTSPFAPAAVASSGGTRVTVAGAGFAALERGDLVPSDGGRVTQGVGCVWSAAGTVTEGVVVDPSTIVCRAPYVDLDCEAERVSVTLDGERGTTCDDTILRVHPPSAYTAAPAVGSYAGGVLVTIRGTGFRPTRHLTCMFVVGCVSSSTPEADPCGPPCASATEVQVIDGDDVEYVSPSEVLCRQPRLAAYGAAMIGVAVDGCRMGALAPYEVIGNASGIRVLSPTAPRLVLPEGAYGTAVQGVGLPVITVAVVDAVGRAMVDAREVDAGWRVAAVSCRDDGGGECTLRGTATVGTEGTTPMAFGDLEIVDAAPGAVWIRFEERVNSWAATLRVLLAAGPPTALTFLQQPSPLAEWRGVPLAVQPRVGVMDAAGHVLRALAWDTPVVCSVVASAGGAPPEQDMLSYRGVLDRSTAAAAFRGVAVLAMFEVVYRLRCESPGLAAVESHPIRARPCAPQQRQGLFDVACRACPADRVCNGTTTTLISPDYWRADPSRDAFERCLKPRACTGGAAEGTCAEGHTGALCDVCLPGWMDRWNECVECSPMLLLGGMVLGALGMAMAVGAAAVCLFLTDVHGAGGDAPAPSAVVAHPLRPPLSLVREGAPRAGDGTSPTASAPVTPLVRTLVDHLSTAMLLGGVYVPWSWGLSPVLGLAEVVSGVYGVDCWMRHFGVTRQWFLVTVLAHPVAVGLLGAVAASMVLRRTAHPLSPAVPFARVLSCTASMGVVVYATPAAYVALTLLRCYRSDAAAAGSPALVLRDMRMECGHVWSIPSIVAAVLCAGVLPLAVYARMAPAPTGILRETASVLPLHRGVVGCRTARPWWYATTVFRRCAVAACVALTGPDPAVQLSAAAWTLLAALVVDVAASPYPPTSPEHLLHTGSLVVLVVSVQSGRILVVASDSTFALAAAAAAHGVYLAVLVAACVRGARAWWRAVGRPVRDGALRSPRALSALAPAPKAGDTPTPAAGAVLRHSSGSDGGNRSAAGEADASGCERKPSVPDERQGLRTPLLSEAGGGNTSTVSPPLLTLQPLPQPGLWRGLRGAAGDTSLQTDTATADTDSDMSPLRHGRPPTKGLLAPKALGNGSALGVRKTTSLLLAPHAGDEPPAKQRGVHHPLLAGHALAARVANDADVLSTPRRRGGSEAAGVPRFLAKLPLPPPTAGSECDYCGVRFTDAANRDGVCTLSLLSSKRHYARALDTLCEL